MTGEKKKLSSVYFIYFIFVVPEENMFELCLSFYRAVERPEEWVYLASAGGLGLFSCQPPPLTENKSENSDTDRDRQSVMYNMIYTPQQRCI